MQVYRVGNDHRLPTHWSYCEAWERHEHVTPVGEDECEVEIEIVDNRSTGAQVFSGLGPAIAATVSHVDGDYGPSDYDLFLLIDTAGELRDGGHYYEAITEADRVQTVDLVALHAWLQEQIGEELDAENVFAFVEANNEAVTTWLNSAATESPVEWYDSLPCPFE